MNTTADNKPAHNNEEEAYHLWLKQSAFKDVSYLMLQEEEAGEGCNQCRERATGKIVPSHDGSRRCESGSIASGGVRAHCSCDVCF